jgi:hypothetical protein
MKTYSIEMGEGTCPYFYALRGGKYEKYFEGKKG